MPTPSLRSPLDWLTFRRIASTEMKLLANENLPLEAVEALREAGYEVVWIRADSPGVDDTTILAGLSPKSEFC